MPDLMTERDGKVLVVTLNRPERMNAMTLQMFARMDDAWREASENDDIHCIVLTGADGNFSSGMDLRAMAGDAADTDDYDLEAKQADNPNYIYDGLLKTARPTKPIVAAVEGNAIAGGTEILQGTDIRVAGRSAKFGVSEVRWSLYPMGGSAVRLARQIPYTEAADILLTGKHVSADEAKSLGLIGHVVDDGAALDKALDIAGTIAANGPLAVEAVLKTLHETQGMTEAEAWEFEGPLGMEVFGSSDSKEGPKAFAEKREPNYTRS